MIEFLNAKLEKPVPMEFHGYHTKSTVFMMLLFDIFFHCLIATMILIELGIVH